MGSVQDIVNCPQCGKEEAILDYYYKSGEEFVFCPICGYQKKHYYRRDKDGGIITQTDTFEVDGQTVGYVKYKELGEFPDLQNFIPFHPERAAKELKKAENESVYIVKLDPSAECGFHSLSFWFLRRIEYINGKPFLQHTYPVVVDEEKNGTGIVFLADKDSGGSLYHLEDLDLAEVMKVVQKPEYREESYVTEVENGEVKILFGAPFKKNIEC